MHTFKPLFVAIALAGTSATCVGAEHFDSTYSDDGRYSEVVGSADRRAVAMLETPSGRIVQVSVVAGGCGGSPACPRVTTLEANGTYVQSSGVFLTDVTGFETVDGAAVDARGRVIVVGTSPPTVGGRNVRVQRYLPNGDLDPTFAGDGGTDVDFFGLDDYAAGVAIDPDDNIVVIGQAYRSSTDSDFGIARLRGSDGSPDPSFSADGQASAFFDLGTNQRFDAPKALAISAGGDQIAVVGIAFDDAISRFRVALARFDRDGSADTTFCHTSCTFQGGYTSIHDGKRIYYFGSNSAHTDVTAGIALSGDGDLYIVGESYSTDGATRQAAVARFDVDGDYLHEALEDGLGGNASFRSVQVSDASAERVLVAGDSGPGSNYLLLQGFSADLVPLADYGNCLDSSGFCFIGGTGLGDDGQDQAGALALDRLGRPLFAGTYIVTSGDDAGSLFARFSNDTGPRPDLIFRNGFQ